MSHLNSTELAALDAAALDHAYALQASLSGLRMDGEGGGSGEGGGDGDGGEGGDGGSGGDGAEGGGAGVGDGGEGTPDLSQQALDAIEALKKTGAEIPEALTAAVTELKNARGEAANYRTKLRDVETKQEQHDQTMQALAKALGLEKDGDDPDPQQLQQTLTQKDAQLKTQTIELEAMKAAPKHKADPTALLDSRSFLDAAAKLDPDSDDFASELDSLVKSTVEANPKLKAGQVPPKGGADLSGGTGGEAAKTLEDAVTARMGG